MAATAVSVGLLLVLPVPMLLSVLVSVSVTYEQCAAVWRADRNTQSATSNLTIEICCAF